MKRRRDHTTKSRHFEKSGYARISGCIPADSVAAWAGAAGSLSTELDDPIDLAALVSNAEFRALFGEVDWERMAGEITGTTATIVRASLRRFAPGSSKRMPWHRDSDFFPGDEVCCIWLALEAVTACNGCLQGGLGSHRHTREHPVRGEQVDLSLSAGDAVCFHGRFLHRTLQPDGSRPTRLSLVMHFTLNF